MAAVTVTVQESQSSVSLRETMLRGVNVNVANTVWALSEWTS